MPPSKKSASRSKKPKPSASANEAEEAVEPEVTSDEAADDGAHTEDLVEAIPLVTPEDLQAEPFPHQGVRLFYQVVAVTEDETILDFNNLLNLPGAVSPAMLNYVMDQFSSILDHQLSHPAKIQMNAFLKALREPAELHGGVQDTVPKLPAAPPIPTPDNDTEDGVESDDELQDGDGGEAEVVDPIPPPPQQPVKS